MEIGDFRKCGTHFSEFRKFYGCLGIHYRLPVLYSRPPVKCSIYLRLGLPRTLQLCAWLVFCILPEAFPRMPELKLHLSSGQQVMQCGFSFWVQDKKGWNSYLNFISFFFFFFFFFLTYPRLASTRHSPTVDGLEPLILLFLSSVCGYYSHVPPPLAFMCGGSNPENTLPMELQPWPLKFPKNSID